MIGKRALVWIISVVFGIAVAFGTLAIFQTTMAKYMVGNFGLMAISAGALLWIWLDYFLQTDMLSK